MTIDPKKAKQMADAYTAAWTSPLRGSGWDEWDLDAAYKVKASRGWYDADDYTRQTGG